MPISTRIDPLAKHREDMETYLKKSNEKFLKKWNGDVTDIGAIGDFQLLKVIGNGAFGTVFMAKHIENDHIVALKLMEKRVTVRRSQVIHVKNEIKLLYCTSFPFLIKMEYFFKDNVYLYLGMPFVNGGEMFYHLRMRKHFDEAMSKFYASQVILALEYLHFNGIVHRDIKPENVLIGMDGFVQLCDFGFCKKIDLDRTYTLCGTPDYMAPELILNKGHSFPVDWWSVGILIYEMAAGYPPFVAPTPIKLYEKICAGKFRFPSNFSKPIRELLMNMIVVDKTSRYGCLKNGISDIKSSQWFQAFDWDGVFHKRIKPTYKPTTNGADDTTNFTEITETEAFRRCSINEYSHAFADFNM